MSGIEARTRLAILRTLRDAGGPMGSGSIAEAVQAFGVEVQARTLRKYLEQLEQDGLVTPSARGRSGGRSITSDGLGELNRSTVLDRVGMTAVKVDRMAYMMDLDPKTSKGNLVLNLTTIESIHFRRAVEKMIAVFEAGFSMGEYLAVFRAGEQVGSYQVPKNMVAIGTVCSVTLNGVLLAHGIPTSSRFGGVLELERGVPTRFTDVIYYEGSSLDPLEIFIKSSLTNASDASATGDGRIGVSFRAIPTVAIERARKVIQDLYDIGLHGVLMIGKPNQPLLDFPVHEGQTGLIVTGGMNPISAVEEAGIPTQNVALSQLYSFQDLVHYKELKRDLGVEGRTFKRRQDLDFL